MARAKLFLSRSALLHNYRILSKKVPGQNLLPMVKANAYGHDSIYVAKTLAAEKNLHGFGVATFAEGIDLRTGFNHPELPILVFSDSAPWNQTQFDLCLKYKLQPVFSEVSSLITFQNSDHALKVKAHVEVNTGMNRLGIPMDALSSVNFKPESIFTHLADAETPNSKLTLRQMKNLGILIEETRLLFPTALLHFANSSAIWNAKKYSLTKEMDLARPGLALYGIRPSAKSTDDGLKRVMRFTAPILNLIQLKKGDPVGYGGTYVCKHKNGEWIAVIGAGYADGIFRSLSSKGIASIGAQKVKILGRVSMDLLAVTATEKFKIGQEVQFWGDSIDPYTQAAFAGTIPYEFTTRVGDRVERIYE